MNSTSQSKEPLNSVLNPLQCRKLHSSEQSSGVHGQLLINLSCSLIGLYILFIVAGHVTTVAPLCGVVAALLQYFVLVFFGWTAAEAWFLYHRLVRDVLGQASPYFVLKAAALVWCKLNSYLETVIMHRHTHEHTCKCVCVCVCVIHVCVCA